MRSVGLDDARRSDAVRAIVQQQPEIVLGCSAACPCLTAAQPTLWPQMLEEWDEAAAMVMISPVYG